MVKVKFNLDFKNYRYYLPEIGGVGRDGWSNGNA